MTFKNFFQSFIKESEEISNNIKNRSPQEIYLVAQDIRKNPDDYPDISIAKIIEFKHNVIDKKQEDKSTGYQLASAYYSEEAFVENDAIYFLRIPQIYKITKEEIRNTFKDFDKHKKIYADIMGLDDPWVAVGLRILRDRHKNDKDYTKLTKEDRLLIFRHYNITAPNIYNYLISSTYNLPKHPTEIPKEYTSLPRSLLNLMYYPNKHKPVTAQVLALDSSRITDGNNSNYTSDIKYIGFCRILDNDVVSEYSPTKKEAHKWLIHINQSIKQYGYHSSNHFNFPTYMMFHALGYDDRVIASDEAWYNVEYLFGEDVDISIQSWKVFRWFLHNIRSTYFTKTQEIHGPAGQQTSFQPIEKISQITDADLSNGIKTSVEKAYTNAARRIAKEFDETNSQKEFDYGREFKDTSYAKVIKNGKALTKEGERMKHCVGYYKQSCLSGRSLIIQLPNSTAELNPKTLQVYQHRGTGNNEPPEMDRQYLEDWITKNKI